MSYVPKTDDEIKKPVLGVLENRVFTSDFVQTNSDLPRVFMVLAFASPETVTEMQEQKISMFYEAYTEAAPVGVNGYPVFFSCHMLNAEDHERYRVKLDTLRKALEAA